MGKDLVVIVDIDSTIADNEHRAAMLVKNCVICGSKKGSKPYDHCAVCMMQTDDKITQESWDLFLSPDLVSLDTPVAKAQEVLAKWREEGAIVHFITGRNEGLREATEAWLTKHFDRTSKERLMMRSNETHEKAPASEYKECAFKELVKQENLKDCIFFFCEDDPWVFDMYSKYGTCIKCPEAWDYFMPDSRSGVGHWQRR